MSFLYRQIQYIAAMSKLAIYSGANDSLFWDSPKLQSLF